MSSPEVRGAGVHPSPHPATPVQDHDVAEVLRIPAFRRLWISLSLSSLGDWLGLLALTALAPRLAHNSYAAENLAVAAVFILRLAPAIVIGPIAGVIADRLDRRVTMVVTDVVRFALFLSIPLVGTLTWLFVATLLIEIASLIWIPAKEASVPNLVPRERLETANQLSLFTTYGTAPVAAALFAGLALLTGILDNALPQITPVDLALYVNAATFLVSGLTILRLAIPNPHTGSQKRPGIWRTLVEGWQFVAHTRLVRGLVVGMLGAFAAGGAVIGLARTFVTDLGGGDPGYGLLFGTVFLGLAGGMFLGPRLLPDFSRRRLFGLAIGGAGLALAALALFPNLVVAVIVTLVIGAFAGVAWVTGYTLLGLEVADELRGRTFAFVATMVRVVLVLVLAVAPLLAAAIGTHQIEVTDAMTLTYNGAAFVFLAAGLLAAALGFASYRHMDDRRGVSLSSDLASAFNSEPVGLRANGPREGFFLALEGGEGAGKSTQAASLRAWLESLGHDVVTTFEPGGTDVGRRLRSVLLDHPEPSEDAAGGVTPPALSPRAEALLFAADRAEHVASVVRPALELGHVVITDRYADSSVAYQGAGRDLAGHEVARLSRWATDGLQPHLTVLLDLPAADGLARVQAPDRLESEPLAFHEKVRERFLELARRGGARYLVVDATRPAEQITKEIRARLTPILPPSAQQIAEADAIRRAEEETRRMAEEARRLEAARARAAAEEQARREAIDAEERVRLAAAEAAALAEVRRQQEELADAERARLAAVAAAEAQRAREEHARQRALHAEERRHHREAAHPDREDRRGHRSHPAYDDLSEPDRDPATRPLSLVDELFGGGDEDSMFGGDQEDRTVQLPRVDQRPDERR
ncbi:MAG TPA: dTMP kinase [Actinomycetes bacterium]|nr:dTMP kinase [Actinomycetes bacterium]